MVAFLRGLGPEFIRRLNDECERGGWWKSIADDRQLFIGIRNGALNVYWKGNSLLNLGMQGDSLAGEVHYKYLLKPGLARPYVQIADGRLRSEIPAGVFLSDLSDIASLKRAANAYAGEEKTGVHQIVMSNPNIIDVEVAFGAEGGDSEGRGAQRIDFAAIQHTKDGPELVFFEAKAFANPELRANGSTIPVLGQMERYRNFVLRSKAELAESYRTVCGNLAALHGVRDRYPAMRETLARVANGTCSLGVSEDVRLVVFGYDKDQQNGLIWNSHRGKLQEVLGENLLLKGIASGFTNGISAPQR